MLAYVPAGLMLAGMAAYTVLAGADFGAGLWTLIPFGRAPVDETRDHARHAMGPVWEANHVWLIFVLVVCWTAYPVAFGSITSTLAAPLLIAAIGIIFRGAAYALRGLGGRVDPLFALSSVLTPFALGTIVGAVALGRVPVGNARGGLISSWLAPGPVLIGALAVAFSGYLAAVYLAADSLRLTERRLAADFRIRALVSGVAAGGLALAGLLTIRSLPLTHGLALAMVLLSGCAGAATLVLCWLSRFELARLTAALAVAAVVIGWAAAQAPRFLPGMTVVQAAAGRSTLIALIVGVAVGLVILIPSLMLLFTLLLRGRLVAPESPLPAAEPGSSRPGGVAPRGAPPGGAPPGSAAPGSAASGGAAAGGAAAGGTRRSRTAAVAVVALVAGAGLLVFADVGWAQALGVVCLVACAVSAFTVAVNLRRQPTALRGLSERDAGMSQLRMR